jgi:hypothetical protein
MLLPLGRHCSRSSVPKIFEFLRNKPRGVVESLRDMLGMANGVGQGTWPLLCSHGGHGTTMLGHTLPGTCRPLLDFGALSRHGRNNGAGMTNRLRILPHFKDHRHGARQRMSAVATGMAVHGSKLDLC